MSEIMAPRPDAMDEFPAGVERWDNGEPVLVLRPEKPKETLLLARIAVDHNNKQALEEAAGNQPLTFLGFLVKRDDGVFAVDENGENPQPVLPGDVFSEPSALTKVGKA